MKKIQRLEWIAQTFGRKYVLPFEACYTLEEITRAAERFDAGPIGWGMRTDTRNGSTQGYQLPFLYKGNMMDAKAVYEKHRDALVYIVCQRIPRVILHGVAMLLDPEHVHIEFNDREKEIAQRHMYDHPENLRSLFFGPSSYYPWNGHVHRCYNPSAGRGTASTRSTPWQYRVVKKN